MPCPFSNRTARNQSQARIFFSTVHLSWPSIQIVNILDKHRFKAIEFEREFYINKKTAIKLLRILKNTFTSQPVILHKDKMSPIATCSEDCVHVPQILKPALPKGNRSKTLLCIDWPANRKVSTSPFQLGTMHFNLRFWLIIETLNSLLALCRHWKLVVIAAAKDFGRWD